MQTSNRDLPPLAVFKSQTHMWLLLVAFLPQASAIKTPLAMTSLEQVMTRAYNARILDGTFDTIYSGLENVFPQPFCSGDISDWPLPEVVPSTDLAAVLERGVFRCGWIENVHYVTTPENVVTIASGNATNQVTGLMADWWLSIVDYVSEESGLGFLDLEWRLYPSSQASFEALAAGEVDALCASWAPDGVYKTPDGEAVARAALFSMQTCPTFLQQKFLFVPSTSPMTTFEELIAAINDGSVTDVCVTGIAGGGFETSCQNTLSLYADGTVTCTGFGEGSFAALGQGTCQAIWDGSPPDGEAANYIAIPLPFFYAPTSYFRQADLPESDPPKSEQTSLELAVTKSFESIIEKGAWNELFDGLISIKPASFCFGDTAVWPLPAAEEGTDLAAVLERGSLRCGYAKNQAFFTADGITLLDTSNPEDIQGLVANLFEQIVADLAVRYNMSLDLEWILLDSSVETFTALANNEVDSACGWWIPNGDWTNPDSGEVLARPLAFSMMQCPTLMQLRPVFTLIESGIDSYTALIEAIEATAGPFYVCVPDDESGGGTANCQDCLSKGAPNGQPVCLGAPVGTLDLEEWATTALNNGTCTVKWNGFVEDASLYNIFDQPAKTAPVSFFRSKDFETPSASAPSQSPATSGASGFAMAAALLCTMVISVCLSSITE